MSDRELLEQAAKAAGLEIEWFPARVWDAVMGGYFDALDGSGSFSAGDVEWAPLTNDGDALRLAVALGLKVIPYPIYGVEKHSVIVSRRVPATDPESLVAYDGPEVVEQYGKDPYAATRLAIVRAAAEIGKAMP